MKAPYPKYWPVDPAPSVEAGSNPYLDVVTALGGLEAQHADHRLYETNRDEWNRRLDAMTARMSLAAYGAVRHQIHAEELIGRSSWPAGFGLVHLFAWGIPDERALSIVAAHSPIVEVGAGTGYWARLLEDRGADVIATDRLELGGHWQGVLWTDVLERDAAEAAAAHPDRALLMVWPYGEMAVDALDAYRGDTLIYVGEGNGGACAPSEFFARLRLGWIPVAEVPVPQWFGLHDYLSVWRRLRVGKPLGLDPARLAGT